MGVDILDLATRRKTVRKFSAKPVPIAEIVRVLETARHAPSGANRQPWRFIVVTDPETRKRLKGASEKGEREFYEEVSGEFREWLNGQSLGPKKPFLEEAPILVVVLMEAKAQYARESVWLAIGYVLLALEELGLSTITYTPSNTGYPLRELDAPDGYGLEAILPIGYSADDNPKPGRKILNEVAFLNRWGSGLRASLTSLTTR